MSDQYGMEERERVSMDHGPHDTTFGRYPRLDRVAVAARHKSARLGKRTRRKKDTEREEMKREIAELRAVVANVTDVLRQMYLNQTPNSSVLDAVLVSLEAKEKQQPVEPVKISHALIRALSVEYDD